MRVCLVLFLVFGVSGLLTAGIWRTVLTVFFLAKETQADSLCIVQINQQIYIAVLCFLATGRRDIAVVCRRLCLQVPPNHHRGMPSAQPTKNRLFITLSP